MRSRRLVASLLASSLVFATSRASLAQNGPPEATVHIKTPGVTLELRPNGDHAWQTGCQAPCDVRVPVFYEYRIAGNGVQPSKPFRIVAPQVDITADPGNRGVHTAGVAADIVGGLAIFGWFVYVIVGTANDTNSSTDAGHAFKDRATDGVGLTLILGGIALSIAGTIMQATSETEVTQHAFLPVVRPAPPLSERAPVWREPNAIERSAKTAISAPILTLHF
jgi:hypothetical protein